MQPTPHSLVLRYGGSVGILLLGFVALFPAVFFIAYGSGLAHYRDGTSSFSASTLLVGFIFSAVVLMCFFFRTTVVFAPPKVSKQFTFYILGRHLPVSKTEANLDRFTSLRLKRRSTGKGVTSEIALAGEGESFQVFSTNDRKRMERDAQQIASFLKLPIDTSDGVLITYT